MDLTDYNPWKELIANREALGVPDLTIQPLVPYLLSAVDPHQNPDLLQRSDWVPLIDQVLWVLTNLYPHLPFKREFFQGRHPAPDPVAKLQALRSVAARVPPEMGELDLHLALLDAIATVRDPHTAYVRPKFFRGAIAFLPFRAGYYDDPVTGNKRFVVTATMDGIEIDGFEPGVELVNFDGGSFMSTVAKAANLTPAANEAAQLQRGLLRLTVRPMASSGAARWREPFEEEAEAFHFLRGGSTTPLTAVLPWGVAKATSLGADFPDSALQPRPMAPPDMEAGETAVGMLWGWQRFRDDGAPTTEVSHFPEVFQFQTRHGRPGRANLDPENLISATNRDKQFGYVAIKMFNRRASEDVATDLPNEFARILRLLQASAPDGIIVDLRNNPGGDIVAAERMLQMLTAQRIVPANFHLANTAAVRQIFASKTDITGFKEFQADARASNFPDGPLTHPHPITPAASMPFQVYQGPVLLLVNASTYSAADIFAGGFADHSVGTIIGTDPSTGGGGANAWSYSDVVAMLPPSGQPLKDLPGSAMSLAFLRSSRVGPNLGVPIEDIGVTPDIVRPKTLNDLLQEHGNAVRNDLISFACDTLAEMPVHRIELSGVVMRAATTEIQVAATGVDRVDFVLDADLSPVLTLPADNLPQPVSVPFHANGVSPAIISVNGYLDGELTTSARFTRNHPRPRD